MSMDFRKDLKITGEKEKEMIFDFCLEISRECSMFSHKMNHIAPSDEALHRKMIGLLLGTIFTEIITPIVNEDEKLRKKLFENIKNERA